MKTNADYTHLLNDDKHNEEQGNDIVIYMDGERVGEARSLSVTLDDRNEDIHTINSIRSEIRGEFEGAVNTAATREALQRTLRGLITEAYSELEVSDEGEYTVTLQARSPLERLTVGVNLNVDGYIGADNRRLESINQGLERLRNSARGWA